jgi:hypothetical protein
MSPTHLYPRSTAQSIPPSPHPSITLEMDRSLWFSYGQPTYFGEAQQLHSSPRD